jgi:hypothetical protein
MKFPNLPPSAVLTGAEVVPITQGGIDVRTTAQALADANESKATDIASAATTDIGAAEAAFVHVTGTTTITALGTVQAGTRRTVVFDGAMTLTHNATSLILPTGANITTSAGDVAMFVSEGAGNWRCVGYLRANGQPLAGGSSTVIIITEGSTSTMVPATHAGTDRYVRCSGDVTFDSAQSYAAGQVYNIRALAALDLIGTGVTLSVPSGGTLSLDADMSVTVIMTSGTAGDVIGQTVAA